jgi:hypothetical protein
MIFRYADKPTEMFGPEKILPKMEAQNAHFIQQKLDGWCTYLVKDRSQSIFPKELAASDSLYFLSRRDKAKGGPTKIPVKEEIIDLIDLLDLPDQTCLVCEWMARRTIGEMPERLFLIDVLWLDDQFQGGVHAWERWGKVFDLFKDYAFKHSQPVEVVSIPETTDSAFLEFFQLQTQIPWTEGVVIKHKRGLMKADLKGAVKNGMMIKLKWRSGASGRETV